MFVGFEWALHDEIVAFITLGAVQNKKKTEHGDEATAKIFNLKLIILKNILLNFFIWHFPSSEERHK